MAKAARKARVRLPADGDSGEEIWAGVLDQVASIAIDLQGREADGVRSLKTLHSQEGREAFLREMVMSFRPPTADPELWLRWLSGGVEPFAAKKLAKPSMTQLNSGKQLDRTSQRIDRGRHRVAKAEAALRAAKADLERDMEHESAVIVWALMERITTLVAPIFAMGPAWTLMRVVGPHVDADEMKEELILEIDEPSRKRVETEVREDRAKLSRRLHAALDLWAGDVQFEIDLRTAIERIVEKYEPRQEEARAKGRKVRSAAEIASSARADAAASQRSVLGSKDNND